MVVIHLGIIMVPTIIGLGLVADSIIETPVVAINQFPVMRVLSTVLREGLQLPLVLSIEVVLVVEVVVVLGGEAVAKVDIAQFKSQKSKVKNLKSSSTDF